MGNTQYLQEQRAAAQKRFSEAIRKTSALIHDLKVLDQQRASAQAAMESYDRALAADKPDNPAEVASDAYSKALIEDSEGRLPWGLGGK